MITYTSEEISNFIVSDFSNQFFTCIFPETMFDYFGEPAAKSVIYVRDSPSHWLYTYDQNARWTYWKSVMYFKKEKDAVFFKLRFG